MTGRTLLSLLKTIKSSELLLLAMVNMAELLTHPVLMVSALRSFTIRMVVLLIAGVSLMRAMMPSRTILDGGILETSSVGTTGLFSMDNLSGIVSSMLGTVESGPSFGTMRTASPTLSVRLLVTVFLASILPVTVKSRYLL
jgi:hypothetical protein